MTFLEDDMLKLRAVEPGDAEAMWEMETDSSQWRENGMAAPYSKKNLKEYAEGYDADPIRAGQIRLIAELKDVTCPGIIGLIDLYDISALNRTAFVGIYVKDCERGKGYAFRFLQLIEKYARMLLNLRILAAKVSERNLASRRVFGQSGFILSGNLPNWFQSGPETYSLLVYTKKLINQ